MFPSIVKVLTTGHNIQRQDKHILLNNCKKEMLHFDNKPLNSKKLKRDRCSKYYEAVSANSPFIHLKLVILKNDVSLALREQCQW